MTVRLVEEMAQAVAGVTIAHVCALEDACMVPELAALVLCKVQPAVSEPEPAAASDRRASVSRTRRLHAGKQVAAVAAAAMPGVARKRGTNGGTLRSASRHRPGSPKNVTQKKKNRNQHQMKNRKRSESARRTGARANAYVCGRGLRVFVGAIAHGARLRTAQSAAVAPGLPAPQRPTSNVS